MVKEVAVHTNLYCPVIPIYPRSIDEMFDITYGLLCGTTMGSVNSVVNFALIWVIWCYRNNRIFNNKVKQAKIIANVVQFFVCF